MCYAVKILVHLSRMLSAFNFAEGLDGENGKNKTVIPKKFDPSWMGS